MSKPNVISSRENPLIVKTSKLLKAADRRESRRYLIEGPKLCGEALKSGTMLSHAFFEEGHIDEELKKGFEGRGVKTYVVTPKVMLKMSDAKTPQGVLAVGAMLDNGFDAGKIDKNGRYLLVERVQDPGNVGTIIRCAHALGLSAVILSDDCADIYSPKVVRATMGSMFYVPLYICDDLCAAVRLLREAGISVYGAALSKNGRPVGEVSLGKGVAVAVGNESQGLSKAMLDTVDECIFIPMPGGAQSLNAAVAAAIIMWEMRNK